MRVRDTTQCLPRQAHDDVSGDIPEPHPHHPGHSLHRLGRGVNPPHTAQFTVRQRLNADRHPREPQVHRALEQVARSRLGIDLDGCLNKLREIENVFEAADQLLQVSHPQEARRPPTQVERVKGHPGAWPALPSGPRQCTGEQDRAGWGGSRSRSRRTWRHRKGRERKGRSPYSSSLSRDRKASWGTSTAPTIFIRFFPSFCFSRSFLLRVMSPP